MDIMALDDPAKPGSDHPDFLFAITHTCRRCHLRTRLLFPLALASASGSSSGMNAAVLSKNHEIKVAFSQRISV
jgi:hypothetical protein